MAPPAKTNHQLVAELNARGHPAIPLDLKRFDWLKITKSIPTKVYKMSTAYATHVHLSWCCVKPQQ